MVGKPIELIGDALPTSARQAIATATSKALQAALKMALRTMPRTDHAGSGLLAQGVSHGIWCRRWCLRFGHASR